MDTVGKQPRVGPLSIGIISRAIIFSLAVADVFDLLVMDHQIILHRGVGMWEYGHCSGRVFDTASAAH